MLALMKMMMCMIVVIISSFFIYITTAYLSNIDHMTIHMIILRMRDINPPIRATLPYALSMHESHGAM